MTATMTADPIARMFLMPFQARSYTNLIYLLLTFPLGLVYFVFLITALSLGVGLSITILGLPILGLAFLASWGLTALERRMAIHLLGAEVPPMGPSPGSSRQGFWSDVRQFFGNPVTWTGMLYLLVLKFPLGVVTFVIVTFLVTLSVSFLATPFLYPLSLLETEGVLWWVDTPAEAGLCFLVGLVLTFISLHLLNGIAWLWRQLSVAMLGNQRFAAAPPAPQAPAPEELPLLEDAPESAI
jgi:hypothetical protein